MRKILITILIFLCGLQASLGSMVISINDIFDGENISANGCQKLDEIIEKFNDNTILIEVFCNYKLGYDYTWEVANIYAYKITKCLIEKGYNQNKIRYIGYGNLNIEEPDKKNVIKISIQEIEPLTIKSPHPSQATPSVLDYSAGRKSVVLLHVTSFASLHSTENPFRPERAILKTPQLTNTKVFINSYY